ncbi:MAG: ATP-binding protein [Oscillospiraceae bacterium]|nr:ATP-binding protein [Oscillospiraceae bacterium]
MTNPLSKDALSRIFKKSSRNPELIGTNEGISVEYKESFGWKSLSEYLRAMAAFANRDGGYIVFGIKDKPHRLLGLQGSALERFENIDNQLWSTNLREYFSPEIIWEKCINEFDGKKYGVLYTYSAKNKPIICKKDADELRKAAIYYRYNSQNSEIDYPELNSIIQQEKEKINDRWMKMIRQIGDSGVTRTALLDLTSGKMSGPSSTLYIDENLLDEISFVQEGSFVETGGNPALKVVGQVQTVVGAQRIVVEQDRNKAINADEIIKSFITEESVNNPLEFVKQICYSSSGNLPVYYFLKLSGTDVDTALAFINDVPINSMAKDILIRRISQKEVKYSHISTGSSNASKEKRAYASAIQNRELIIPSDEKALKYSLSAICGTGKELILPT